MLLSKQTFMPFSGTKYTKYLSTLKLAHLKDVTSQWQSIFLYQRVTFGNRT